MSEEEIICCICGKKEEGEGNNPSPIKKEGRCCNACNISKVMPLKVSQAKEQKTL